MGQHRLRRKASDVSRAKRPSFLDQNKSNQAKIRRRKDARSKQFLGLARAGRFNEQILKVC